MAAFKKSCWQVGTRRLGTRYRGTTELGLHGTVLAVVQQEWRMDLLTYMLTEEQ